MATVTRDCPGGYATGIPNRMDVYRNAQLAMLLADQTAGYALQFRNTTTGGLVVATGVGPNQGAGFLTSTTSARSRSSVDR